MHTMSAGRTWYYVRAWHWQRSKTEEEGKEKQGRGDALRRWETQQHPPKHK
jgi:hypothetical protein